MSQFDAEERTAIRDEYEGLRVPDVVDALDSLGFHINDQQYLMDHAIGPVFRDDEEFSHTARGFAFTARYRPPSDEDPAGIRSDATDRPGMWYDNVSPAPYLDAIRDGDFLVATVVHKSDLGLLGSLNTLEYIAAGATGMVTDAGCRDIEEVVRQGFPVYAKYASAQPGRIELDDTQVSVAVGGVDVRPGDFVVADASGIAVVPTEHVHDVAEVAQAVLAKDAGARGDLYEELDLSKDDTVR